MLEVKGLQAQIAGEPILNGVNFAIDAGKRVLLLGPNGSGKTTLVKAILGDNDLKIDSGDILLDGKSILKLNAAERARLGIFVTFQSPVVIPGVNVYEVLLASLRERGDLTEVSEVEKIVDEVARKLNIDEKMLVRSLNDGFSGGEKKKFELLQMLVLKPKYVIMDEPDSGLDADAVQLIAKAIDLLPAETGVAVISHDPKRLKISSFDAVYIMKSGSIAKSGGAELIDSVLKNGYEKI